MTAIQAWLFCNRYGGISAGFGRTAAEAKTDVLSAIAESFAEAGLSASAARQAAYSYSVRLVGGPMTPDEAGTARRAWEAEDWEAALAKARPHVRRAYGLPPEPDGTHELAGRLAGQLAALAATPPAVVMPVICKAAAARIAGGGSMWTLRCAFDIGQLHMCPHLTFEVFCDWPGGRWELYQRGAGHGKMLIAASAEVTRG